MLRIGTYNALIGDTTLYCASVTGAHRSVLTRSKGHGSHCTACGRSYLAFAGYQHEEPSANACIKSYAKVSLCSVPLVPKQAHTVRDYGST